MVLLYVLAQQISPAWMRDQSAGIITIIARVDHVFGDQYWLWYLLYIKCLLVSAVPLSQPSSRVVDYPLWEVMGQRCMYKKKK